MATPLVLPALPQTGQKPWTVTPQIQALADKANELVTEINTLVAGGGGGAVSSVAGRTGDVVLGAGDVAESATRKWMTPTERAAIANGTGAVASVAGRTGTVVLAKADVGLGNVDNTADASKPISTAQAAVNSLKIDSSDVDTVRKMTAAAYAALSSKDSRTFYIIVG